MQIAFLLGSGVSIPAGMPSTGSLTEKILSGTGITRDTSDRNGPYCLGRSASDPADEYVSRVLVFLKRLKVEIDLYYIYELGRSTSYEDLYYISNQVSDTISREYDNPAVLPLISRISPEIQPLLNGADGDKGVAWTMERLADEAGHYIHDVVRLELSRDPSDLKYLRCIKDACQDSRLTSVGLFTLNHDTVLEHFLHQNNLEAIDGFGELDDDHDAHLWNPALLAQDSHRIRLVKLHGSVNWHLFPTGDAKRIHGTVGITSQTDFLRGQIKTPRPPVDGRPVVLIGTFNKMLEYTRGIFVDLYCQFHRYLRQTEKLVVIGYGFSDKGINSEVVDWFSSSSRHQVIIVDPAPQVLQQRARPLIRRHWDKLTDDGRNIITGGVESISWDQLFELMR